MDLNNFVSIVKAGLNNKVSETMLRPYCYHAIEQGMSPGQTIKVLSNFIGMK